MSELRVRGLRHRRDNEGLVDYNREILRVARILTIAVRELEAEVRSLRRSAAVESGRSGGTMTDALKAKIAQMRAKHSSYGIYDECGHRHTEEQFALGECVEVDDVGLVCGEGLRYHLCRECHTEEGEVREDSWEKRWPCDAARALDALEEALQQIRNLTDAGDRILPFVPRQVLDEWQRGLLRYPWPAVRDEALPAILAKLEGK